MLAAVEDIRLQPGDLVSIYSRVGVEKFGQPAIFLGCMGYTNVDPIYAFLESGKVVHVLGFVKVKMLQRVDDNE